MDFLNQKLEELSGRLSAIEVPEGKNLSPDEIAEMIEKMLKEGED